MDEEYMHYYFGYPERRQIEDDLSIIDDCMQDNVKELQDLLMSYELAID